MKTIATLVTILFLSGCAGLPEGIEPVGNFHLDRYLGKWYEVARLDHSFERGLEQVTAEYSLREDGGVRVLNRGFSTSDGKWQEAEGKAYFVEDENTGYLKVSFFGPFYGSYVIFELDTDEYQYSFISGPDRSYLWLLSRTPEVSTEIMDNFLETVSSRGFEIENLIIVDHSGI